MNLFLMIFATLVFNVAGLVQVYRIHKRKSARDVSVVFLNMLLLGVLATAVLAIRTDASMLIIIERVIGFGVTLFVVFVASIWRIRNVRDDSRRMCGFTKDYWDGQLEAIQEDKARRMANRQHLCVCSGAKKLCSCNHSKDEQYGR